MQKKKKEKKVHVIEVNKRSGFSLNTQNNKTQRGEFFNNTDCRNSTCGMCCTYNAEKKILLYYRLLQLFSPQFHSGSSSLTLARCIATK